MAQPELILELSHEDKRRKLVRVKTDQPLFVIGSSDQADLRLNGISGCHAALRFRAPHWYLCDLSSVPQKSESGLQELEQRIEGQLTVELAGHRVRLFAVEKNESVLAKDAGGAKGVFVYHQVVVRHGSRVLESRLLPITQAYHYQDGEYRKELPPPTDGHWKVLEVGPRKIQQRLVGPQELLRMEKIELDRELRKPLMSAIAAFLLLFVSVAFVGRNLAQRPEAVLDQKSLEVIYNAKAIKKKKIEAQKIVKTAKARAGGQSDAPVLAQQPSSPTESTAPNVTSKSSRALTSLRQSGLSNLIGKIAKRANKQGVMVAAQGVSADQNAGVALFSVGSTMNGGGGSASKAGPTFRLGGIATKGRAGGVGNFRDGTALAGGSIGSGNLVAMVDEETVVEGGLDRDAIAEVIRRNLGQVRYCYERQLSSNPDLYGKVLVKFTIGAGGEVLGQRVDNSTLKSAMVEGCIMRRMASWKFPEPKGGTQVNVTYPFLFKAN